MVDIEAKRLNLNIFLPATQTMFVFAIQPVVFSSAQFGTDHFSLPTCSATNARAMNPLATKLEANVINSKRYHDDSLERGHTKEKALFVAPVSMQHLFEVVFYEIKR